MIFFLFIFIPIIEIVIFISIGSNIGILNTIFIIFLTAIIGIYLVRKRGLYLLFNAQHNLTKGIMPTEEIKGGIFLLISGLLLITPGFFTDVIGFSVFLKPVQKFIILKAKDYFQSHRR
ncbi:FxsA family protein [Alphaproteobacteria bacterium]|nr:FxsA family protein [Alphaproteobacteria bacterium]